ncbi:aspartate/glutamate racemase family protein [Lawsonibacter celer]|jgi:aspartate racemase|uniref:aspartate/glutamate racemase family protein n=1 Tax=Lawsonibacter celer TaxID=2986526 RepID=UPI001645BC14|nr:amino acid racemase [Lawsonibacter celer]
MEQRLGILGGMGPQATQDFYQRILDRTEASCDQEHLPTLILSDTGMPDRTAAILGGDAEGCFRRLLSDAQLLERSGCTALAIPCNTSHFFADRLQEQLGVPIIHMPRRAVAQARQEGWHKVGILATDGTVQTGVYQKECAAQGILAVSPPEDVQKIVMSIIYDEIKRGEKGSREKFALIDRWLRSAGCDGGILACTELSVYRTYHSLPDYYLDAMDVLAEECITACGYKLRMV